LGPLTDSDSRLPSLEVLLERMARAASIYMDSALSFTVDERTEVSTFNFVSGYRNSYVAPKSV
jgi:hypothetical protein